MAKVGRPRIVWSDADRDKFEALCRVMCTREEVADVFGIDHKTLARLIAENYPDTPTWEEAFRRLSAGGRASLRRRQYELAMDGDKTMLIWLGKQLLGQREPYKDAAQPKDEQPAGRPVEDFRASRPSLRMVNGS